LGVAVRLGGWVDEGEEACAVAQDVVFGDAQLKVEHVKELALDPPYIAFPKHACAERPVDVLER
jgi:hypothetical protein